MLPGASPIGLPIVDTFDGKNIYVYIYIYIYIYIYNIYIFIDLPPKLNSTEP